VSNSSAAAGIELLEARIELKLQNLFDLDGEEVGRAIRVENFATLLTKVY
jgi:hypothetical protein